MPLLRTWGPWRAGRSWRCLPATPTSDCLRCFSGDAPHGGDVRWCPVPCGDQSSVSRGTPPHARCRPIGCRPQVADGCCLGVSDSRHDTQSPQVSPRRAGKSRGVSGACAGRPRARRRQRPRAFRQPRAPARICPSGLMACASPAQYDVWAVLQVVERLQHRATPPPWALASHGRPGALCTSRCGAMRCGELDRRRPHLDFPPNRVCALSSPCGTATAATGKCERRRSSTRRRPPPHSLSSL